MAFTTFLLTVLMVTFASADWPGWSFNNNPFSRFHSSLLRFGPPTPPSMPRVPSFLPNFPYFQPPVFPTFPIPSVADIMNRGTPFNGGTFNGVIISSKSGMKKNEDGTIVQEGGSTIVTNNNGKIKVTKTGNAPPEIELLQAKTLPHDIDGPKIRHPSLNKHKHFDIPDFHSRIFEDIHKFVPRHPIPAIDPEEIKSHVPGPNEKYVGSHFRMEYSSSNNNGRVKQGGSIDVVENDNGRVRQHHIPLRRGGDQP